MFLLDKIKFNKLGFLACFVALIVFLLTTGILSSCSSEPENNTNSGNKEFDGNVLVITGSTTMLEVTNMWAEEFMAENGAELTINGGGSGEGINSLINETTDLANSSREIQGKETQLAMDKGMDIREYTVLLDGIAIVVSNNVKIGKITIEQLSRIFRGEITNWKEVGGDDKQIVAAARDSTSGTGEYFLQEVVKLGDKNSPYEYTDKCLLLQSTAEVVNVIGDNDDAIGYIGLGYLSVAGDNIKSLGVAKYPDLPAVFPTAETVKDNSYPLSRGLYIYANMENLSDLANAYLDFIYSQRGQEIGSEAGFVPVN